MLSPRSPAARCDVSGLRAEALWQKSLAQLRRLSVGGYKTPILHQHGKIARNKAKKVLSQIMCVSKMNPPCLLVRRSLDVHVHLLPAWQQAGSQTTRNFSCRPDRKACILFAAEPTARLAQTSGREPRSRFTDRFLLNKVAVRSGYREGESRAHRAGASIPPGISWPQPQPDSITMLPGITDWMDFTL